MCYRSTTGLNFHVETLAPGGNSSIGSWHCRVPPCRVNTSRLRTQFRRSSALMRLWSKWARAFRPADNVQLANGRYFFVKNSSTVFLPCLTLVASVFWSKSASWFRNPESRFDRRRRSDAPPTLMYQLNRLIIVLLVWSCWCATLNASYRRTK